MIGSTTKTSLTTARLRLLNPGPVTLTDRVRRALAGPDLCHRDDEFTVRLGAVRRQLEQVYDSAAHQYGAVLLTGSGTAAVEAMVGSLVPRDGRALVMVNGVYGERMAHMLQLQGKACDVVRSEWTAGLDLEAARQRLSRGGYSHVLAVHHETTTGRLNDLPALGQLCRRHNVPLLLDAVSSFAGEEIDFAGWNLEACAATSNKCLHGVPGLSFVLVDKSAVDRRGSAACSLYLDLWSNYRAQCGAAPLFTPAVQTLYALQEALDELEETGGWRQRRERYRQLSGRVRYGLRRLGLSLLLEEPLAYSCVLTSFRLPHEVSFPRLFAHLKQAGFVIYPGQQSLQGAIFRIAVMGDLTDDDVGDLLDRSAAIFQPAPSL